jgi:hypothetical protein
VIRVISNRRRVADLLEQSRRAGTLPAGLRFRRHPDQAAAALELRAEGPAAEQLAAELEDAEGRRYWHRGRWRTARKQLQLPGIC